MNKSESIKELGAALAAAQAEFPPIPRTKTVKVKSDKGSYEFKYAPFEDILRATKDARAAHGLAYSQGERGGVLETIILHKSGEWMAHETKLNVAGSSAQAWGSALTYARRYGFCAAFGVQADDDDDANAADGNHIEAQSHKPREASAGGPSALKREAFDAMPKDEQEFLRKIAANVSALISEDRAYDAYGFWINQKLDTEEMVAIQSLWDSKERSALTKAAAEWKLANTPSTRGDKHTGATPQKEAA